MKAVVVEDSRLAREGLIRMLRAFPQINIVGAAANVDDALIIINKQHPEVLFLDIHMPEENAFDLLARIDYSPKVVFTTAYAEYAVQSFDFNTFDYLLKPISQDRLAKAVNKLCINRQIEPQNETIKATSQEPQLTLESKILVKDDANSYLIPLKSVDVIESCKNYVVLFWQEEGKKLPQKAFIKKPLSQVEARLPKHDFFRTNRQFIINLHSVINIEDNLNDGFDIKLTNGRLIDVSRRNSARLKSLLSL